MDREAPCFSLPWPAWKMSSRTESRAKAPYELAFVDRVMLVIEDAGGEPLQRLLPDPPMEVGRFLRLAIGTAHNTVLSLPKRRKTAGGCRT